MHPDLQRKLIRFLHGRYKQVIIATHSVEIISEVEPENILIVDKLKSKSIYANKLQAVQKVVKSIGSIHNLQLAKLASSKKLLIVEGKDVDILKRLQNKLYPLSDEPFDSIPKISIGGWGGWRLAIGSNLLLKNSIDEEIIAYCLFDRDYHTEAELEERLSDAKIKNVELHIWAKKEIENYLLIPDAIYRIIRAKGKRKSELTATDVKRKLNEIIESLKEETYDSIASELQQRDKKLDFKKAKKLAREVKKDLCDLVSGKEVLSQISEWSHNEFGLVINAKAIALEIGLIEMSYEMKNVIKCIEENKQFK